MSDCGFGGGGVEEIVGWEVGERELGDEGAMVEESGKKGANERVDGIVSALGRSEKVGFHHFGENLTDTIIIEGESRGNLKGSEILGTGVQEVEDGETFG